MTTYEEAPDRIDQSSSAEIIALIASFPKDQECPDCHNDGDEPAGDCTEHRSFDMPNDDAVSTLHALIDRCRQMIASENLPDGPNRKEAIVVARQLHQNEDVNVDDDATRSNHRSHSNE